MIFAKSSEDLVDSAKRMRVDLLRMTLGAGNIGAHIGGSLSLVEIMAVLYLKTMNHGSSSTESGASRDRLILSKGHGVMAQYAAMVEAGIIKRDELKGFKKDGGELSAHPSVNDRLGIDFSSGSLGQGLSLGVGVCLALKRCGNNQSRVFVIVGDGECDEGQVWEAAMTASHYKLDNLVCIVDRNHLQYDGDTEGIKAINGIGRIWESFGWHAILCDGHDIDALVDAFSSKESEVPLVVIADTVKGKGVSFMEGVAQYHNSRLTAEQFEAALSELEGSCEIFSD